MSHSGEITFASGLSKTRRACDTCRGRKIKCVPSATNAQDCDNCVKKHLRCTFRDAFKLRHRMAPKKASPGITLPPLAELAPPNEHFSSVPSEPGSFFPSPALCSPEQLHALSGLLTYRQYSWGIDRAACEMVLGFFSRFGPNNELVSFADFNQLLLSHERPNVLRLLMHSMATHHLACAPQPMRQALEYHHQIARDAISDLSELNERLLVAALGMLELVDSRFNLSNQKTPFRYNPPCQVSPPSHDQPWLPPSDPIQQ